MSAPRAPGHDLPSSAVLRRALVVWGLGHLALGDRRGWLLLVLQPLAIAALLLVAVQLIDGTRWLVVFPAVVALLVIWLAQAVHAHQRAIAAGAAPGGELQATLFLPLAVTVLTVFWLLGGRHGSPVATVEAYMAAWMAGRADTGSALFSAPAPAQQELAADWQAQTRALSDAIGRSLATYGPSSGLDPARPFANLRVRELEDQEVGGRTAGFVVEIVRSERFATTVLGFVPTAGQRTVIVAQALEIWVREERQAAPLALPVGQLESGSWKIYNIVETENQIHGLP